MKQKRTLLLVLILVICLFVLTGCFNKEKEENKNQINNQNNETDSGEIIEEIKIEPMNPSFNSGEVLKSMYDITKDEDVKTLTKEEIEEKYNFGKYSQLQKTTISKNSGDDFLEITIVELGSDAQAEDIFTTLKKRVESLKKEYANEPEILKLLSGDSDTVMIKIQDGVGVLVINKDAKKMINEFDKF